MKKTTDIRIKKVKKKAARALCGFFDLFDLILDIIGTLRSAK